MDPTSLATLLQTIQEMTKSSVDMAKSNQELVAAVQAGAAATTAAPTTAAATAADGTRTATTMQDTAGAVALTNIKLPLDMGDSAEERLVNFHEWKEEIMDKLTVAGVLDGKRQTTIALMWGGRDIKTFATEKAGVVIREAPNVPADTWDEAVKKIEKTMEEEINESFAMYKFRQLAQNQRNITNWHKQLKSSVKTLRLNSCTCGNGYSEERAIRDIMVELTTDSKLRKDGLSKDLKLDELLKEGEANELARARSATVENKSVNKLVYLSEDEPLTAEQESLVIAKLKQSGKYSVRTDKKKEEVECDRCTKPKRPHTSDKCYFVDQECRSCKEIGHMKGARRCKNTKVVKRICVSSEEEMEEDEDEGRGEGREGENIDMQEETNDYEDKRNWSSEASATDEQQTTEITLKQVTSKKNVVKVKVGERQTDMFADSGADVNVAPTTWYKKEMGTLEPCSLTLSPYGTKEQLPVEGKVKTTITTEKGAQVDTWIYLVKGDKRFQPLLGDIDATALGFLSFKPEGREPTSQEKERKEIMQLSSSVKIGTGPMPDVAQEQAISEKEQEEAMQIIKSSEYHSVFDGHIGKMKKRKPITLHADQEKDIVSQPFRAPPPQFQPELSAHLQFLRDNDKIADVDPNTEEVEAVSNVVLTRKPSGKMRMNLDARPINAVIKDIATPHMTTPEDVRHRLAGSTRFTEFDMNHGYNQSTLSEESSKKYGVFQTHEGFHRFKGLYFGHSQATQAFNEDVKKSLRGVANAESVADNILVHSKTAKDHKKHIAELLDR